MVGHHREGQERAEPVKAKVQKFSPGKIIPPEGELLNPANNNAARKAPRRLYGKLGGLYPLASSFFSSSRGLADGIGSFFSLMTGNWFDPSVLI